VIHERDGQTDGQTLRDSKDRACIASRGKNRKNWSMCVKPIACQTWEFFLRHSVLCRGLWPASLTLTEKSGLMVACGSVAIGSLSPTMRVVTLLASSSVDSQSVPTSCEIGRRFPGPVSMPTKRWSLGKPLRRSADGGLSSTEVPDQKFGFCLGATGLVSMVVPWSALPYVGSQGVDSWF